MNFLLQQRKGEISDSLKHRPPWKLAEEEERKLITSPFFVCARSDQFIIFWFGGFILSIFCFLPQLSPPSGSKREEKKSAKHQAPGGSQVLHCQKKKKKNPTLENK